MFYCINFRLALVLLEGLAEFHGADIVVDVASDGVTDGACLLADDYREHVELLGDADGAAVAQAQVGVDVEDARNWSRRCTKVTVEQILDR